MLLSQLEIDFLQSNPNLIGIDEAGRGPWAGPVVVCAYLVTPQTELLEEINDSKRLSEKKRNLLFEKLTKDESKYSLGITDNKRIDEVNILNATKKAITQAYEKFQDLNANIIIDGQFGKKSTENIRYENHADGTHYAVAAASVIAKVTRDNLMIEFAQKYPNYGFEQHKGYGTKLHQSKLAEFGPCEIHRYSYKPVAMIAKKFQNNKL